MASASKVIMCKKIGHDTENKKRMFLYNGVIFSVAAAVIFMSMVTALLDIVQISLYSFILAIIFAIGILFTQSAEILAMNFGSVSMTMMIFSCGFLIPILYGVIFLSETVSVLQIIGLLILIIALILIISPKGNEKTSVLWLILSVLAMLGSGANAVIQKIHQASEHKHELMPFLFWALIFSSLFSFAACFLTRGSTSRGNHVKNTAAQTAAFLVLGGICVGILNILNLHLAGKLAAAIQFPVYSIGSMILSGLGGRFIYKETLSVQKLIGFGVGCAAITVIALF